MELSIQRVPFIVGHRHTSRLADECNLPTRHSSCL